MLVSEIVNMPVPHGKVLWFDPGLGEGCSMLVIRGQLQSSAFNSVGTDSSVVCGLLQRSNEVEMVIKYSKII